VSIAITLTARFGNDFNSALNQPALFPILLQSFKSDAIQYVTNAFDRFNDISETWRDDPTQLEEVKN
jgi:hypothetical protein